MSVQLQILDVIGSDTPLTITVNGTAVCLAGENITVQVVLVPTDFSTPPLVQPARVTPVGGAIGLYEWTATFAGGPIPDLPLAVFALAYNVPNNALLAEADEIVSQLSIDSRRLGHKGKVKKKAKKVNKKSK